jgi:GNAT superfamily N-acetyltransferase
VTVRRFEDCDLPAVHDLIQRTIDACYPAVYPRRAVAFFKAHHSREAILRRAQIGTVLVIDDGRDVVATGALVDGEIAGVFVSPQSQLGGLGATVMGELERIASASGFDSVGLDVSLPSRGFYEHRGYRVVDERALDVGEGEVLTYWRAVRVLAGES